MTSEQICTRCKQTGEFRKYGSRVNKICNTCLDGLKLCREKLVAEPPEVPCTTCKKSGEFRTFGGKVNKTCNECLDKKYCECGKIKGKCLTHGGGALCECGKVRSVCLIHGGGGLCECGKVRSICLTHGGGSLCECGKIRSLCSAHGGGGLCECGIRRSVCLTHGGGSLCECGKLRSNCTIHRGSGGLCECGKRRERCYIHGTQCPHERLKERCKICDKRGHLVHRVSGRMYKALRGNKSKQSIEYLGCSIEFFREYITQQFIEGQSWENYGEWEIDHIIPILYNDPTLEEVEERLHYTNTQPLWAIDNMRKGNRWIG